MVVNMVVTIANKGFKFVKKNIAREH